MGYTVSGLDNGNPEAATGPAYQEAITINADTGIPLGFAGGTPGGLAAARQAARGVAAPGHSARPHRPAAPAGRTGGQKQRLACEPDKKAVFEHARRSAAVG